MARNAPDEPRAAEVQMLHCGSFQEESEHKNSNSAAAVRKAQLDTLF
jgi:hypothetical protein